MSVLTKVFVVLLVVCSMLLTAAIVVFVNQTEHHSANVEQLQQELAGERLRASNAEAARQAAEQREQAVTARFNTRQQEMDRRLTDTQQQIASRNVDLADLRSTLAIQEANVARLAEALQASEDSKSQLQHQVVELRRDGDQLVRRNSELNQRVSDLNNRLEVSERDRRYFQEQLTEAQTQLERATSMLRDAGVDPDDPEALAGIGRGAPLITGRVREVERIEQIPYATINVGSADNVREGMIFHILDPQGAWLGQLRVERVEPNEAIGQLEGPGIDRVQQGAQVRTQL